MMLRLVMTIQRSKRKKLRRRQPTGAVLMLRLLRLLGMEEAMARYQRRFDALVTAASRHQQADAVSSALQLNAPPMKRQKMTATE